MRVTLDGREVCAVFTVEADPDAEEMVKRRDAAVAAEASLDATDAEISAAVVDVPKICIDSAKDITLKYNRTNICYAGLGEFSFVDLTTWEEIGHIKFNFWQFSILDRLDLTFSNHWEVMPYYMTGAAVGAQMVASASCNSYCSLAAGGGTAKSKTMAIDKLVRWETKATSKVAASKVSKYNKVDWAAQILPIGGTPSEYFPTVNKNIRCDRTLPGHKKGGCVVASFVPTITFAEADYPQYYSHVLRSIGNGSPSRLTRMANASLKKKNGSKACPSHWPRPTIDHECDEFPMRSTYEGAYTAAGQDANGDWKGTAIGRTFKGCGITALKTGTVPGAQWSSCMIDKDQNQAAGQKVKNFYLQQRLLDRDPYKVALKAKAAQ
ncbi:hypothetical protein [Kineosporia sp. NBRC 101731]|uniref:hypothetical protein n=1 Tax=Kineosporia sp. NBRC 101731 TaxID=3032199 RepID=UPI00255767D5|nr:hypothetical protein [Kineosporia sp. NBRC 101731]